MQTETVFFIIIYPRFLLCVAAGVCTRFCRFILDTNEPPSELHGFEIFSKKKKKRKIASTPSSLIIPQVVPGFAYGGDFGDRPTDREFCVDGLVLPDRRNTPKMDAVKAAYAPLKMT